jgi:predicted helicase
MRWIGYFYAQFHSPTYRQRYATFLRVDFPRVFLAKDPNLWEELSELGCQLLALHLGPASRTMDLVKKVGPGLSQGGGLAGRGVPEVASGYPKFSDGSVWINRDQCFTGVSQKVWNFCVGAHQVCRKWLRDRRGRELSKAEIENYSYLVRAVGQTRGIMTQIDRAIQAHGGWAGAFT